MGICIFHFHIYINLKNAVDVSLWYDFEKRLNTFINDIDIGRGLFDSIDSVQESQDGLLSAMYNKLYKLFTYR